MEVKERRPRGKNQRQKDTKLVSSWFYWFLANYRPQSILKEISPGRSLEGMPALWETQVQSLGRKDPWKREWQPTSVFFPGEFYGLKSLVGYSPWGHKESNMTEQLTHIYISSVQSLSRVRLFSTPWTAARQASLSITNSRRSPKLVSIESVMPSSHLILCRPLLLLPPIPPSISLFQ